MSVSSYLLFCLKQEVRERERGGGGTEDREMDRGRQAHERRDAQIFDLLRKARREMEDIDEVRGFG